MKKYLDRLDQFTVFLKDSGYKNPTISSYYFNLKDFLKFLNQHQIEIDKFNNYVVKEYFDSLKSKNE